MLDYEYISGWEMIISSSLWLRLENFKCPATSLEGGEKLSMSFRGRKVFDELLKVSRSFLKSFEGVKVASTVARVISSSSARDKNKINHEMSSAQKLLIPRSSAFREILNSLTGVRLVGLLSETRYDKKLKRFLLYLNRRYEREEKS
jgi:hypothetical protein